MWVYVNIIIYKNWYECKTELVCVCVRVMASNCFWLAFVELSVRIPLFFLFFLNSFVCFIFHFITIPSPSFNVNFFHFIWIFSYYLPFVLRLLLILFIYYKQFFRLKLTKSFLSVIFLYPFICHSFQFQTLWQRFYIIVSKFCAALNLCTISIYRFI